MALTVRAERCSDPSVSVSAGAIASEIALSSLPMAFVTFRFGASATAATLTRTVAVDVAPVPSRIV
jgi:hypothetical protein